MTQYTDSLGNPISEGDIIVYPTQQGSSSAQMTYAYVERLIALVEAPGLWHSTGPRPWVREDQRGKQGWTGQYPEFRPSGEVIPEKAYVIGTRPAHKLTSPDGKCVIKVDRDGRRGNVRHNRKVVVVNRLVESEDV